VARGETWVSKRSGRVVAKLGNPNAAKAAEKARARLKANADLAAQRVAGVINSIIARAPHDLCRAGRCQGDIAAFCGAFGAQAGLAPAGWK
jgi:hypothetical protein